VNFRGRLKPSSPLLLPSFVRVKPSTLSLVAVIGCLAAMGVGRAAAAQPAPFGSSDDPLEVPPPVFGRPPGLVGAYVGPAFIGSEWTLGVAAEASGRRGPVHAAVDYTLHVDEDGFYDPEVDELIDIARAVRYLRLEPAVGRPLYVRAGPLRRVELSSGQLVRGFGTWAAHDERAPGLELAAAVGPVDVVGFVEDVRLGGVAGVQVQVSPLRRAADDRLRTVRVAVAAVHDAGPAADSSTTAVQVDARGDLARLGGIALTPWASYARFLNYGQSLGVGADVGSSDLVGTARVRFRLGLFASSDEFVPGYFSPLYAVANVHDRVIEADGFYDADTTSTPLAGIPLGEASAGLDVVAELRILAFGQFEVFQHIRRHIGAGGQSAYAARVAYRPRDPAGVRLDLMFERQGFKRVLGLFGDLRDLNALVLDLDAPLPFFGLRLSLRSRYGYERLPDAADGGRRFLVQRRFEPLVGLRWAW
jgi:hypothetical protein